MIFSWSLWLIQSKRTAILCTPQSVPDEPAGEVEPAGALGATASGATAPGADAFGPVAFGAVLAPPEPGGDGSSMRTTVQLATTISLEVRTRAVLK